jgi:hypothetical protein
MNIEKLTNSQLDWAVSFCENLTHGQKEFVTNWANCGPIIDKEQLSISWEIDKWVSKHPCGEIAFGKTALVAAMKAYVLHKFPVGINIPDNI